MKSHKPMHLVTTHDSLKQNLYIYIQYIYISGIMQFWNPCRRCPRCPVGWNPPKPPELGASANNLEFKFTSKRRSDKKLSKHPFFQLHRFFLDRLLKAASQSVVNHNSELKPSPRLRSKTKKPSKRTAETTEPGAGGFHRPRCRLPR